MLDTETVKSLVLFAATVPKSSVAPVRDIFVNPTLSRKVRKRIAKIPAEPKRHVSVDDVPVKPLIPLPESTSTLKDDAFRNVVLVVTLVNAFPVATVGPTEAWFSTMHLLMLTK